MFSQERQRRILSELEQRGRVEDAELAGRFGVSEDTVRRDLKALAGRGYLHKTHGGAVALDPGRMSWAARADLMGDAKAAIGALAATLVQPGQTVLLDAGSTVLEFARRLNVRPLNVVTNSLDIAALFAADEGVALSLTGGEWDRRSRYFTGVSTLELLASRRGDWAFLGACAVHPAAGLTSVAEPDAAVKRAMLASAERTVLLADSSKAGQIAPYLVAPLNGLYAVVTDDAALADTLAETGVRVLVPDSELEL